MMFSELNAPANQRKRRVLIGAWLLHAGLWLAFAQFALLLRQAMADEFSLIDPEASGVMLSVWRDQVAATNRFFVFAAILCLGMCAMSLFWTWQLLHQRTRAWYLAIAWMGFEYLSFCSVIWLVTRAPAPEGADQPPLLSGDQRWMVGFLLAHMLVMFAIPFIHLWVRRAYALHPGEHSDGQRFKWRLEALGERLMRRLFNRQEPPAPVTDQRPAPPPIPEDIERRHMWPSAPLPPVSDLPPSRFGGPQPPDDDHLRS